MRGEHRYVRPIKRTTAPPRMVCAVPELYQRLELMTDGAAYYHAKAVWYTDSKRNKDRWTGSVEPKSLHPDDWWEYVNNICRVGIRLYIVCDNACDLCTITGFWKLTDMGRWSISYCWDCKRTPNSVCLERHRVFKGRYIVGGPPDIITATNGKGTVCLVSLGNYTQASWSHIADRYRGTNECISNGDCDAIDDYDCPSFRSHILTRHMRDLITGWIRRDCGPWKDTIAQLSVAWWRKSFYTAKVTRHADSDAIRLERSAAYGGRNEVWYYGDCGNPDTIPDGGEPCPKRSEYPTIQGTIYRCDVSSQYPAILATEAFPVRLRGVKRNITIADLKALLRYYEVIAHVRIGSNRPEYPINRNGTTYYPTGRYDTTIAGPELRDAISSDSVQAVYEVAWYERGYPLRDYAKHLLAMRQDARESGDYCEELLAKSLSTAIGGKFSQRTRRREAMHGVTSPFDRWGPFTRRTSDGRIESMIAIAGVAFHEVEVPESSKLLSAVYCYLTSYGRCQMRSLREAMGRVKPYAQCTDGIWVSSEGRDVLSRLGLSDCRIPGMLRLQSPHTYARWITPCHYYIDGRWTLAGYKHGYVVNPDATVTEYRDKNPVRSCPFKAPMAIKRECIKRDIAASRLAGRVGDDGWLIPPAMKG